MPKVTELIRRHLLTELGIGPKVPDLDSLRLTERCEEFETYRMNRKVLGAMRYGLMGASGKSKWARVPDMIRRLQEYSKDKNAEHLVDVANLAELEYVEGDHLGIIAKDGGLHTSDE